MKNVILYVVIAILGIASLVCFAMMLVELNTPFSPYTLMYMLGGFFFTFLHFLTREKL